MPALYYGSTIILTFAVEVVVVVAAAAAAVVVDRELNQARSDPVKRPVRNVRTIVHH